MIEIELEGATRTAKLKYPISFAESGKRYVLSLHYSGSNSFLFVNTVKMCRFKEKDSEIKPYLLCNIPKDFTLDNMKKTGLKGNVWAFSVEYNPVNISDILDIHKCLMKETFT